MKKLWIWIIAIVVIIAAVLGIRYWRQQQTARQQGDILRTATAERGTLEITVAASGNVAANEKADLRFTAPGTVAEVLVDVGEYVEEGDVLARLDTADLERAVQQAELALEQAQLNLDQLTQTASDEDIHLAQLAVQQASQALEVARVNKEVAQSQTSEMMRQATTARDRASQTYNDLRARADRNEIPGQAADQAYLAYLDANGQLGTTQLNAELQLQQAQNQWLQAYNGYQQAQNNLQTLQDGPTEEQVRQAELQVEQARLSREQAQAQLDNSRLTAPFDGVVAAVNLQAGVQAATTLPALTLIDDSVFFVDITVDETDIGKLEVGQTVAVTLDAYPSAPLEGEVVRIAPAANNVGGIVAYPIHVRLQPSDTVSVRDGMTANVIISTSRKENVLLVPNWAVRTNQTNGETYTYCYRIVDGTPQRTNVTIGGRNESYTEVLSGLDEGATVALVTEERVLFDFQNGPGGPPQP